MAILAIMLEHGWDALGTSSERLEGVSIQGLMSRNFAGSPPMASFAQAPAVVRFQWS